MSHDVGVAAPQEHLKHRGRHAPPFLVRSRHQLPASCVPPVDAAMLVPPGPTKVDSVAVGVLWAGGLRRPYVAPAPRWPAHRARHRSQHGESGRNSGDGGDVELAIRPVVMSKRRLGSVDHLLSLLATFSTRGVLGRFEKACDGCRGCPGLRRDHIAPGSTRGARVRATRQGQRQIQAADRGGRAPRRGPRAGVHEADPALGIRRGASGESRQEHVCGVERGFLFDRLCSCARRLPTHCASLHVSIRTSSAALR